MIFFHLIKTAFIGLKTNKTRSALTILGIVIGVTSIILIVSIGRGAEQLILNELGAFGADMIAVRPGQEPTGPSDIAETLFADSLKNKDVEALRRKTNVPAVKEVIPAVIVPGSISYRGETYRPQIYGWSAEFFGEMFDVFPEQGVFFTDIDIRRRASVVVLGAEAKEELFGEADALGKSVKIKDRSFRVVGILPARGQVSLFNVDKVIIIPYTTAQLYLLGIDYYHEILVRVDDSAPMEQTVRDIELTLRESHGITDPDKDDFFVVTQEGVVDQIATILGALTAFLLSVVAISLVVGGIGVMNIMLVSVTERTKEIGLRKAVGATEKDILVQFLLEAIVLTGLGGIIGIIVGFVLALVVSITLTQVLNLTWVFAFPISAAVLGVGVSAFVGLIFGIYPARKAARKDPIEALRYE